MTTTANKYYILTYTCYRPSFCLKAVCTTMWKLDFNNLFYFNEKPESMKDQLELNSLILNVPVHVLYINVFTRKRKE